MTCIVCLQKNITLHRVKLASYLKDGFTKMYSRSVVVRFIVSIIDNDIIMVSGVLFTALNDV